VKTLKLTFISDTHNRTPELPGGDILIHCGDLTEYGYRVEVIKQLNYLNEQLDKYKYVVVIPGNHDFWIEKYPEKFKEAAWAGGLIPLINEGIELEGLNFYGSPATPAYHDWAFNYNVGEIMKIWERIPSNTDVLITHGPPDGILDTTMFGGGKHAGCVELREKVAELKPLIHAFGHIHEQGGEIVEYNGTTFINAATEVVNFELTTK
jgi:Icc-related predicted phosphoesterase